MTRRKKSAAVEPAPFVLRDGHALVLRTCAADLTSYGEFQWPESGVVEAPDWNTHAACGNGLHGLLWGIGDGSLLNWDADARWLVVDVVVADVVEIGGKVKFPRCEVVFCGAKDGAVAMLIAHGADSSRVVGSTITGGDGSTITGGYGSTITGGDRSTITGGDRSTITGGYRSTITGGDGSTITGGDRSTITGGANATMAIRSWDEKQQRRRFTIGYIGEDGLEPNVAYRLDENGKFIRAEVPS